MKHLLKLMTFAALAALLAISCGKENQEDPTPTKPVVTADMYSVTANPETGEVVFKFTANGLSPFWTITDPTGTKTTFTDREVTKTYTVKGTYKGSLIAYGDGGQSDPVDFTFTVGAVDPSLSATENILISNTWKIRYYGWYGGEGEEFWDYHEKAPVAAADDRMTFKKGGAFELNLGEDKHVYNDDVEGGWQEGITVTGNEKWAYVKEGGNEYVQFSDGGFPGMLGGDAAINGKYLISNLEADSFSLCYQQTEEQWFYVTLVPDWFEEPAAEVVTEDQARAALSGRTLYVSAYGWWGEGWEYFDDPVEDYTADDRITFGADGSLTIDQGETLRIYNDCVSGGEEYVVEGPGKWRLVSEGNAVLIQFSDGGFPLMLAGMGDDPNSPDYHLGLNGKWTIYSIDGEGTVRVEIYQEPQEQWLTVFLSPVA